MALCTAVPELLKGHPLDILHEMPLQCISNLPDLEITSLPIQPISVPKTMSHVGVRQKIVHGLPKAKENKDEKEIVKLLKKLPILDEHFNVIKKIGEGTYSTVYLASYKNSKSKKQFAIKNLTDNFSLSRIQKELRFMQIIGGCDNVVNVLNCFRNESKDCVVFVMPYLPHTRFSDYVLQMDASELRVYIKNLLIALKRVHSFNVIHRDVKPGNFLYNRSSKEFLLVDFGLAQEVNETPRTKNVNDGENTPINYSKRKRSSTDEGNPAYKVAFVTPLKSRENIMTPSNESNDWRLNTSNNSEMSCENKLSRPSHSDRLSFSTNNSPSLSSCNNMNKSHVGVNSSYYSGSLTYGNKRETSLGTSLLKSQTETKLGATPKNPSSSRDQRCFTPLVGSQVPLGNFVQVRNSLVVAEEQFTCPCSGLGAICCTCGGKRAMAAPRAGTPGFRPPEVLLKYLHQTTAVDMWAVGVVLLCVLSGCYPFFKSPSDLAALAEIMTIFGSDAVSHVASKFGRRVACSDYRAPLDVRKMCRRLHARRTKKTLSAAIGKCQVCQQSIRNDDGCVCRGEMPLPSNTFSSGDIFPDSAYHLLLRLLDLNPETRITAADALNHPFITGI